MEMGAAITILIFSQYKLPVSTSMCITGATVGVGLCNGTFKAVNWQRVGLLFFSWVMTIPIGKFFHLPSFLRKLCDGEGYDGECGHFADDCCSWSDRWSHYGNSAEYSGIQQGQLNGLGWNLVMRRIIEQIVSPAILLYEKSSDRKGMRILSYLFQRLTFVMPQLDSHEKKSCIIKMSTFRILPEYAMYRRSIVRCPKNVLCACVLRHDMTLVYCLRSCQSCVSCLPLQDFLPLRSMLG